MMPHVYALKAFIFQRYPLAVALRDIDDEALEEIVSLYTDLELPCSRFILMLLQILALRDCAVSHPQYVKLDLDSHRTDIVEDISKLYLLIMFPCFSKPAEFKRTVMRDGTHHPVAMPSVRYSQIACTLLSFLMSGTQPSLLTTDSHHLDGGSTLLRTLAIRIIVVSVAKSSYSAALIVQLTQFFGVWHTRTVDRDTFLKSSFQQLAPIVVSHCIVCFPGFIVFFQGLTCLKGAQSEASASMDQSQLKQLEDLIERVRSYSSITPEKGDPIAWP